MDEARTWFQRQGLTRMRQGRWVAGICAAVGRRYDVPVWAVRLAFVVLCFVPVPHFIPLLAYFVLWFLMPKDGDIRETY